MTPAIVRTVCSCLKSFSNSFSSCSFLKRLESTSALSSSLPFLFNNPVLGISFERSIWYLAPLSTRSYQSSNSWPNVSCMCGSFHSKTDATFSKILKREIEDEKKNSLMVPTPTDGWMIKQKEATCILTKTLDNDRIEVSFNVNASVPPIDKDEPEVEHNIVSQPDFSVEIRKSTCSEVVLLFECYFPDESSDEDHDGVYSIRYLTVHEGKAEDSSYVIDADFVDPNVYHYMLAYLKARGITNDFAEDLVGIATAIENKEYISTLEHLQNFVSCR